MPRIGIVAALEREVRPLVKRWRVSEREHEGRRFRFFEKDELVVVCGGIGSQAARRAAEAAISDGSSISLSEGQGVLISFAAVTSPEQKWKLRESYGAHAVDMESAAVASAAEAHGIQLAVIKVISDQVDFELPPMERFVNPDGSFAEARFAMHAALRPWTWRQVVRLAGNTRRAARALCDELEKIPTTQIAIGNREPINR
jgi:nucleoside phosphorylase